MMLRRAAWAVALASALGRSAAAADEPPAEVEVRGDPGSGPPKEPSVAGSVIRAERLRGPGLEAADVLRTQPGVTVLETGGYGSLSTASLRGATAAQTPVYLAGVRLNDDVGGAADLSLVPLWFVNRIEVYRSNAPLAGDELGIGGAIFFEPRRSKGTEALAGAMAGSFGAHALWAGVGLGDAGERAGERPAPSGFVAARFDDARNDYTFVNDGGTRFEPGNFRTEVRTNADARTADVWAVGGVPLGEEARVDLVANDVEREQGLPGLPLFPNTRARGTFSRRLVGITGRAPCPDRRCEVTATAAAIATRSVYSDPLLELALGTTRSELDAARVDDGVAVSWALSDRVSLTPAVRASIERLAIVSVGAPSTHASRVFSRAALQGQWDVSGDVTLRALGAAECHGTSLEGTPPWALPGGATGPTHGSALCSQAQPSARAGVQIGRAPVTLLATIGRYARVPTLTELYGLSGVVRGNTALVPEVGVSVEAGLRAAGPPRSVLRGASVDVFGFLRTASDLVAYQRSSSGYVRPFNIGSGRVAGLELLADWRPARFVLLEVSATLLDARNTSAQRLANDVLPYQPAATVVPRLELRAPLHVAPLDSGKVSASYFYESSRYADPAGLVVIPSQGSLDVEAEVAALHGRLALRARVANALDQTRFDLIGYPLPGRAAYVALEAQW